VPQLIVTHCNTARETTVEELIARITDKAGVDESTARSAVEIILSFLYEEGDREKVVALVERIPGAEAFVQGGDPAAAETLGGFGGLMGSGAMAAFGKLQTLGLGMGQIQGITQETVTFARERAGDEIVNAVVSSIPGLSQFV
jgi:hypothetical protein